MQKHAVGTVLLVAALLSTVAVAHAELTCCSPPTIQAHESGVGVPILVPNSNPAVFRGLLSPSGRAHKDAFGEHLTLYLNSTCSGENGQIYQEHKRFWLGQVAASQYLCQGVDAAEGDRANELVCGDDIWPNLPVSFGYKTPRAYGTQYLRFLLSGGTTDTSEVSGGLSTEMSWVRKNDVVTCQPAYAPTPQTLLLRSTDTDGDGDTDEADERRLNRTPHDTVGTWAMDLNFDGQVTAVDHQIIIDEILRHHTTARRFGSFAADDGTCEEPLVTYNPASYVVLPPENITSFAASRLDGCNTVRLSWRAPNEGADDPTLPASGYEIRQSSSPIVTLTDFQNANPVASPPAPAARGTIQTFDFAFTGDRFYAIRAKDDVGNWSAIASTSASPGRVTDLSAAGGRDMIKLTWTAAGADSNCGQATSCELRFSTSGPINSEAAWANATGVSGTPFVPAAGGVSQCLTLDMLDCAPTYYFALKTTNAEGHVSILSNSPSAKPKCTGSLTYICEGSRAQQVDEDIQSLALRVAEGSASRGRVRLVLECPKALAGQTAEIQLHDVLGRSIAQWQATTNAGTQFVDMDLRSSNVHAGVFYARLRMGEKSIVRTIVLTQ